MFAVSVRLCHRLEKLFGSMKRCLCENILATCALRRCLCSDLTHDRDHNNTLTEAMASDLLCAESLLQDEQYVLKI